MVSTSSPQVSNSSSARPQSTSGFSTPVAAATAARDGSMLFHRTSHALKLQSFRKSKRELLLTCTYGLAAAVIAFSSTQWSFEHPLLANNGTLIGTDAGYLVATVLGIVVFFRVIVHIQAYLSPVDEVQFLSPRQKRLMGLDDYGSSAQ
eukprot:gene5833-9036_t